MLAFVDDTSVTKYPIGLEDLSEKFPNTSFTLPLQASELTEFGVVDITEIPKPSFNQRTQRIVESDPVLVDGVWTQQWKIQALSVEEQQQLIDTQTVVVRAERNKRLADCDWTQLPDALVDRATWAIYRQELKDVPQQAGFPWNVTWPTPPQ